MNSWNRHYCGSPMISGYEVWHFCHLLMIVGVSLYKTNSARFKSMLDLVDLQCMFSMKFIVIGIPLQSLSVSLVVKVILER